LRPWAVVVAAAVSVSGLVVVGGAPSALAAGDDSPSVPAQPLNSRTRGPVASDATDPAWLHPTVAPPSPGSADVAVPVTGYARAGDLPVYVGPASTGEAGPASVRVQVIDQATAADLGAQFFVIRVTRTDGSRYGSPVSVQIDYSGIRRAYGGNYASRLRLQRFDVCVLSDPACATPVDAPAHADLLAQRLVADVVAAADPTAAPTAAPDPGIGPSVYSMSSTPSAETGTYTASPMPMTDRWQVGPGSGDFDYSYPIPVPPPVGGPSPSLSLDYSSQSVDGRTLATNSQPSQVGEGWSLETGYVERRFVSCSDDGWGPGTANAKLSGNLCWAPTMAYFLHLGGKSDEIVQSASTNEWRLRDDPAWRVQSWTGAANGDNDGEYFTVFTPDGTKYWFGLGTEPRNTPTRSTNSTLNVPVFAGSSGEPCYNAVAALSYCSQAWRWNLDRVQDPATNVESLFYTKETNYYTRDNTLSSAVSQYDRASEPSRIEYSKRSGSENVAAPSVVTFSTAHRCATQSACPAPTPSSGSSYPDVPLELMCTSATSCSTSTQTGPSFWSTEQISRVTTWILNSGGGLSDVDTVDLAYSFPVTTDGTDPSLWLRMITRTGVYGGSSIALPSVLIGGIHLANRVDYNAGGGVPQTDKYRVNQIVSETGGETDITYGSPDPCPPYPTSWDTNTTDCFPQYFDPPGPPSAGFGIFHKYLVTQVVDDDLVGVSPNRTTTYTYEDTPAWHYANELNLPITVQSWSDYRGYSRVKIVHAGDADTAPQMTRFHIYRGMDGDRLAGGATRSATVTDEDGNPFQDFEYLAGRTLETDVFSPSGTRFQKQQHRYWRSATLPGPATTVGPSLPHSAQYVRESVTADLSVDTSPGGNLNAWRSHEVDNTYSATYGVLTSSYDGADNTTDDTCRKLTYAVNVITSTNPSAVAWVLSVPYNDKTVAGLCTGTTVVKNTDLYYDGSTTLGATPTWGRITQTAVTIDATHQAVTKVGYDGYNRVVSATSPNGNTTGTVYAPSTGFPYTNVTVSRPLGVVTKTTLSPAWSTPVQAIDANTNVTNVTRDALGRITAVQRPDDTAANPSTKYVYVVAQGSPSRVNTRQLLNGTNYLDSFVYYDGFGDAIETHTESPGPNGGRVVTATKYDQQGNPHWVSQPFWNASVIGTGVVNPTDTNVPVATKYRYDSVGRRTVTVQLAFDALQWTSSVTHFEWSDLATFPVHSDVTTDLDVFGRPKNVVERPSGTTATTSYAYTLRGDLAAVTDAVGNHWNYAYDLAGRRTDVTADPDRGTSHAVYDADGNVLSATDGAGTAVTTTYDALGRRTTASAGATTLATWTYDDAAHGGLGLPASATRIVNGNSYTVSTPGYDSRGRPKGVTYSIPASEGGLAGTYAYTFDQYDAANHRTKMTYPAVGSLLAQEQVTSGYSAIGYATTLTGASTYVGSTTYGNFGQLVARQLGSPSDGIARTYGYDDPAHRLTSYTAALTHAGVTSTVQSDTLTYDADSNVVSDKDVTTGQTECFRYTDGLDRLTAAFTAVSDTCTAADTTGPDPYNLTYTYDKVGRTTAAIDGGVTVNPAYPATATPSHPVHGMSAYGTTALTYDGNGMLHTRTVGAATVTLTWDELHAAKTSTSPTGAVTSFVTDASGNRLIRHDPDGTGTLYLDGMEVTAPLTAGASPTTATRYYGPATRIAGGPDAGLWWQVGNQQNSATVTVNATTGLVRTQRYRPYGRHRNTTSSLPVPRGFLDKTEDPTGYDDLGARLYDPKLGQFTAPDPLTDPSKPQSLNPYAYSRNNPSTLSDPTGRAAITGDGVGGADHDCVNNGNCGEKYAKTVRQQHLTRIAYMMPGYLGTHTEDTALVVAGYGDTLTSAQLANAGDAREIADELMQDMVAFTKMCEGLAILVAAAATVGAAAVATVAAAPAVVPVALAGGGVAAEEGADQVMEAATVGVEPAAEAGGAAGDYIVLGLRAHGLEETATKVGGRTLLSDPDWMSTLQRAVGDPSTKFTISLDGLSGSSTYSQILSAAQRGASGFGGYTDWELSLLYNADRLGGATLVRGGVPVENPWAP
jgi:RHS repeat-associated protein